jgi:hypothetical protein
MSKVDPVTAMKLAALNELGQKVQRVHGLVEQFAAAQSGHDALAQPLKRAFRQLKMAFTGAGLDSLAQIAAGMEIAAGRGGSPVTKSRILRDGIGSIRSQIEVEQRILRTAAARNDNRETGSDDPKRSAKP